MKCEFCGGETGDESEMCDKCFDDAREKFAPLMNAIADATENCPEEFQEFINGLKPNEKEKATTKT